MTFDEALSYLLSLGHETLTIKLGLENTYTLLSALGDPHKTFPSVQIAGTNGKGSTAVMLDSICHTAGIRTGLFTSPHLISITERIRVNGEQISATDFAKLTERVKATAAELVKERRLETLPTFFEQVTAIALLAFREANVELVILETGLGGRLDSTTAAGAQIVAITPVAMDHEEYLGNTLTEIAAEKAAIIRPDVVAVIAPQQKEVLDVILSRCEVTAVTPRLVKPGIGGEFSNGRCCATLETGQGHYENVRIGLRGRHQMANATVAIALAEALREHGFPISKEAITTGIENARHAGRLEMWEGAPRILFDGAHNPAAARALRDYLSEFVNEPVTMIFGAMRDKNLCAMAALLFPLVPELILVEIDNPRAARIQDLVAVVPESFDRARLHHAASESQALDVAQGITPGGGLICITGSLYLVGALRKLLRQESPGVARRPA